MEVVDVSLGKPDVKEDDETAYAGPVRAAQSDGCLGVACQIVSTVRKCCQTATTGVLCTATPGILLRQPSSSSMLLCCAGDMHV